MTPSQHQQLIAEREILDIIIRLKLKEVHELRVKRDRLHDQIILSEHERDPMLERARLVAYQ